MDSSAHDVRDFQIVEIKGMEKEKRKYVDYMFEWLKHLDQNSYERELARLDNHRNQENCWIYDDKEQIIGIVKFRRDYFYGFGIDENVSNQELMKILKLVENHLLFWGKRRYYGSVNAQYIEQFVRFGFKIEFSREKMRLEFENVVNKADYSGIILEQFNKKHMEEIILVFADAYKGSVDEQIGMFNETVAKGAIQSILDGKYGIFKPELTQIAFNENKKIIGVSMISILEDVPFVVIIGVLRDTQNRGLGRKLLSANIDRCIAAGYKEIRLWVTVENTSAQALYRSMGFETVNKIYSIYKN